MDFDQQTLSFSLSLLEELACPRSLMVAILLRNRDWEAVANLRCNPSDYKDASSFSAAYQATELLRKYPGFPGLTAATRRLKAEEGFLKSEESCFWTNHFIARLPSDTSEFGAQARSILERARAKATEVLGRPPTDLFGRHGPGATFRDTSRACTVVHKMQTSPTLTAGAIGFLFPWCSTLWAESVSSRGESPCFVKGNRFTTVPKDAFKDRGIAVEPSINIFFQLAIGDLLKRKLFASGLDVKNGWKEHRLVAGSASADNSYATIDLSAASDTVCYELVRAILPPQWLDLLDSLRSPMTLFRGKWVYLEKYSSMGNGFTFELETLIFYSLISAVCSASAGVDCWVFGDDIIVKTDQARDVVAVLRAFGFEPNERKTFVDGPFRESCGGDFFMGVEVTPFRLDNLLCEPHHLISLANGIRRASKRPNALGEFSRTWYRVIDAIPKEVRRCRGPEVLGDLVIHDHFDRWTLRVKDSWRYVRVWRPVPRGIPLSHFHPPAVLAAAVLGAIDSRSGVTPRNSVSGYRLDWVPYS